MRELHWHANAAEWAFVVKGRVRTTVISPDGAAETNDFDPGDVWYFPRGHGHMLECLGNQPCHFILIFDNGYFSEFGTFSITDWIGHTPKELLAKKLRPARIDLRRLPQERGCTSLRAWLPPMPAARRSAGAHPGPLTHKYRLLADQPRVDNKGGRLWLIDSSKFPISKTITGQPSSNSIPAVRELHWHPTADEWQYVYEGKVSVTLFGANGRYRTETLDHGDVGYIPQGYGHSLENVGAKKCRVLIGFNSGIYEDIDLSEWIAGNPPDVLATNFGKPASLFQKFPHKDVFIADGSTR